MQPQTIEDLLGATQHLIGIESTADNPAGRRDAYEYVRARIQASGKPITIEEFEISGTPSMLAYYGAKRPKQFHILLNVHLDVVPGKTEQFVPFIQDGKLYGRGAYDMKAAAIVLAQVFCEYADTVPYALGLQVVTDEEDAGKQGTYHHIQQGVRADLVICGECGRADGTYEIANEAKGVTDLEVHFRGRRAHGAYPWKGSNAALKATAFLHKLHDQFPAPEDATRETTVTLTGLASGGAAYNQTPDSATVRLDCRFAPDDVRFKNHEAITALIHSIDPEATIKFLGYGSPMQASPDNPLILSLKAAAEQVEGNEFSLVRRNGSSDGRFYTEIGGEACEFGIAGEHQHADNEHVTIDAFQKYLETMQVFIQKTSADHHQ